MRRIWRRRSDTNQKQAITASEKGQRNNPNSDESTKKNHSIHGRFHLDTAKVSKSSTRRNCRSYSFHSTIGRMENYKVPAHSHLLSPENVAAVPPPGMAGPNQPVFAPSSSRYLAFVSTSSSNNLSRSRSIQNGVMSQTSSSSLYVPLTEDENASHSLESGISNKATNNGISTSQIPSTSTERLLLCIDLESDNKQTFPLLRWNGAARGSNNSRSSSKRRMLESSATTTFGNTANMAPLDDRLKREKHRVGASPGSLTQFSWTRCAISTPSNIGRTKNGTLSTKRDDNGKDDIHRPNWRILVPARGSLYIQDGFPADSVANDKKEFTFCTCIHDKAATGMAALDAQLSPDGSMVAWTSDGEIYVQAVISSMDSHPIPTESPKTPLHAPIRVSFGAAHTDEIAISHGVADFVAQEEMDRYRGFWWHPDSCAILFTRNDESQVPLYRIMHNHQDSDSTNGSSFPSSSSNHEAIHGTGRHNNSSMFEDHRYPFAGKMNPKVKIGFVQIDRESILDSTVRHQGIDTSHTPTDECRGDRDERNAGYDDPMQLESFAQESANDKWERCLWFDPPREASEYLARVYWLPDGSVVTQWQNRSQNCSLLYRLDLRNITEIYSSDSNDSHSSRSLLGQTLLVERSDIWINLHHMFKALEHPIHPSECKLDVALSDSLKEMPYPLPCGSFSFVFASERTGFQHLYLYTYCPGVNGEKAVLLRALTAGDWIVESILGIDVEHDLVYFTGTYDSVLERHLYAVPLRHTTRIGDTFDSFREDKRAVSGLYYPGTDETFSKSTNGGMRVGLSKVISALSGASKGTSVNQMKVRLRFSASNPCRLTHETGMHTIVMDDNCKYFVDTSSDLDRPTTVIIYELIHEKNEFSDVQIQSSLSYSEIVIRRNLCLYDASTDEKLLSTLKGSFPFEATAGLLVRSLPAPDLLSFPTTDGSEILHAAIYRPDPNVYGSGPYPLVCAVYGGPHVQRVNRSWAQCADMRAQRLRSLGFCVIKCDNRGSSRRGLKFESAIAKRLGRIEVLDQVAAVRQLTTRGFVDPSRVGVYGWSYGGYLAAMCLCRAPDVFQVAVAGAPVTSWDGYDTHYTERYMGLPSTNVAGYRESAVFEHVPNMRGKLMIVHGLIDENVHFRHSSRLINRLIAHGKDYDLLVFPEERHSPRRLRDRIYMEQRISDYFVKHLLAAGPRPTKLDLAPSTNSNLITGGIRHMAGHL